MRVNVSCISCVKNQLINSYRRQLSASSLKTPGKLRRTRLKKDSLTSTDNVEKRNCSAYYTGESAEYNFENVKKYFDRDTGYRVQVQGLPKDADALDALHVSWADEDTVGDIFLFRRMGAFVCWNIPEEEVSLLKETLLQFAIAPSIISEDTCEHMHYFETQAETTLLDGDIYLNTSTSQEQQTLEKLSFSNAMALSVRLDMWEDSLEEFSDSLRYVPGLLKNGGRLKMSRKEVLKKMGELLTIRHEINLYSDVLLTPEFYWDHDELEQLYVKTCADLDVSKRTTVMNAKMDVCCELVEMLRSHLNDEHSHRLEWLIIILIIVEVAIEVLNLAWN